MPQNSFNRFFEVCLLLSNALLAFVVIVKLHVSPADVYHRVQQANSEMILKGAEIIAQQHDMQEQIDARQVWIEELTACMRESAEDRWTKKDELQAWEDFFAANPMVLKPLNFYPEFKQTGKVKLPEIPKPRFRDNAQLDTN